MWRRMVCFIDGLNVLVLVWVAVCHECRCAFVCGIMCEAVWCFFVSLFSAVCLCVCLCMCDSLLALLCDVVWLAWFVSFAEVVYVCAKCAFFVCDALCDVVRFGVCVLCSVKNVC